MTPPPRSGPWNSAIEQIAANEQPTTHNEYLEYYREQQRKYRERHRTTDAR